jgi:protein-tyrosine phosphatase
VIDLHAHILPGLDDGAPTIEAALAMARAAVADGVTALAATPHVRSDYPTSPDQMEHLVGVLRRVLREEQVPLELLTGGEIALDLLPELDDDALRRFGLGGSSAYILLEFPYSGWPLQAWEIVLDLGVRGIRPVFAHPERNPDIQANPRSLVPLVEAGALIQLTAASLDGRLGSRARSAAADLIDRRLVHLLASDSHAADGGRLAMRAAVSVLGDPDLGRWLTLEVPGAIVAGEEPPGRPSSAPRSRRRSWSARFRRTS